MTDSRKTQLDIGVNAAPAKAGFKEIEQAGAQMGRAVSEQADKAGKSVAKVGDGADGSAQKLDRATKSIISSVERATAAMQAGERGTAKYFETLGNQRGANLDALRPYITQLEAAEAAQRKLAQAQGATTISAAQMNAAMRGVPAQFTDIITSLQGGQAPMTVLLQQGGQLKDMFGGIGNAAKALGGYMLGLVNPLTVVAAAMGTLALAAYKGSEESKQFARALLLTGNSAGTTVGQLQAMAQSLGEVGLSQSAATAALTTFVNAGGVGKSQLEDFAGAAARFARASGQSITDVAKNFADLAKDPVSATLKLNEGMNFLNLTVYRSIKAFQDQGKFVDAARLAQQS